MRLEAPPASSPIQETGVTPSTLEPWPQHAKTPDESDGVKRRPVRCLPLPVLGLATDYDIDVET
ncbi:hypothetical protein GCM10022420_042800 [Streptomyces iranensis]